MAKCVHSEFEIPLVYWHRLWNKSHMANIIPFWLNICASVPFFWHGTGNVSTGTTGRSPERFCVSQGIPELHTAKLQLQPCQRSRVSFHLTLSGTKHWVEICWKKGFNKHKIFRLGWTSFHKSCVDFGILTLAVFLIAV